MLQEKMTELSNNTPVDGNTHVDKLTMVKEALRLSYAEKGNDDFLSQPATLTNELTYLLYHLQERRREPNLSWESLRISRALLRRKLKTAAEQVF